MVFTLGLSDLAAVRIHNERVFPVKSAQVRNIEDVIENLQRLMNGTPPPGLRRVLCDAEGNRVPLDEQEIDGGGARVCQSNHRKLPAKVIHVVATRCDVKRL